MIPLEVICSSSQAAQEQRPAVEVTNLPDGPDAARLTGWPPPGSQRAVTVGALSRWSPDSSSVSTKAATPARLTEFLMLIFRRGAACRRPVAGPLVSRFLAFQLSSLLHGLTDLRAGKPEMPWPGADEMIEHYLICLGLRAPRRPVS